MGYHKLDGIDDKLLEAIVQVGAGQGVPKATIKRVAAMCKVSHIVVLKRFGNTRGSWDAAAQAVDTRGMKTMEALFAQCSDPHEIWEQMLDYYLLNSQDALFYTSYINTVGFDPTENNPRNEEYLHYAKLFFGADKGYADRKYLMLWDYLTSMLFYYVEKVIHGYLQDDGETRKLIQEIVFSGLDNL